MDDAQSFARPWPRPDSLELPPERYDDSAAARLDVGCVAFATMDERDAASIRLGRAGMVVAELEGVGPSARGRLADLITETIERELAGRGSAGPGLSSVSDRDAMLSDQLFRARRAGATGIAIVLGPLRSATGPGAALDPEDCAALRFLAGATRGRPLTVVLDERDRQTWGYGDPVTLGHLLAPFATDPPTAIASATPTAAAGTTGTIGSAPPIAGATAPAPVEMSSAPPPPDRAKTDDATWLAWTLQLGAARGRQPLAALERLFAESYMPLTNAVGAGLDDLRARRARDDFNATFATGYVEAFATFAATTKRPRMVLDAHDVSARIARLHGARSVRLLLVDAMRWDLSRDVQGRVTAKLGARAALTEELLLWSALPTTTMRQLETIARGVEALRSPAPLENDPQPLRVRNADHVRRMRVGPRELYKLDIVESRLQAARGQVMHELPEIAEATAEAIVRHVETLAPRTLLFVFGDHGFTVDKSGVARYGGASPEEVLVGAFALLVGDVH
jgi:hypothetical protein